MMTNESNDLHEIGDAHDEGRGDLSVGGVCGLAAYSDLDADTSDVDFDDFGDLDASDYGNTEECVLVGFLGDQNDLGIPYGLADALNNAASNHVSISKASKTGLAKRGSITEDDFEEGPQADAFRVIRAQAENLFSKDPRFARRRPDAIAFFFGAIDDQEHVTLQLCCDVLNTRPDVLRLRVVYEFWLRRIHFDNPMPFLTVAIPNVVVNESILFAGDPGLAAARAIWQWPGVSMDNILHRTAHYGYEHHEVERAIARLMEEYVLSEYLGGWYVTGRNPVLQSMREQTRFGGKSVGIITQTVHWSRLF
jgi:hypothetical protein